MHVISDLYRELISGAYKTEVRLAIGDDGNPDNGCDESSLFEMKTYRGIFSSDSGPTIGSCVSGEIDVELIPPSGGIPRQAKLVPHVRITDGTRHSEWLQKGVYYIDTRETVTGGGVDRLRLHGYDDLLKAEQDYPATKLEFPAVDIDVVREIAQYIGVDLDERTVEVMTNAYTVQYPGGEYTCRETLGYIAAMYGGCFVMSDYGKLRLVRFYDLPPEQGYLITSSGDAITFGGVRIRV